MNVVPFSTRRFSPRKERTEPPEADASADSLIWILPSERPTADVAPPAALVEPLTAESTAVAALPRTSLVAVEVPLTTPPTELVTPPTAPPTVLPDDDVR